PKKKGIKDECSRLLEASTMKSRRGFAIQRLMNAMRQAHADGWFIVFDTLTLADDRLEAFYDNPNALRDRKSGSAGMPRPISYAVFCLKKKRDSRNGTRRAGGSGTFYYRRASGRRRCRST